MSIQDQIDAAVEQLRKRKHNRERKRRLKQGSRARREARAVRSIRKLIAALKAKLEAPRLQYDAVTASHLPRDAKAAAFYVDGLFENEAAVKAQCPNARYTSIAVFASSNADCLDIEPGNATVEEAADWYRRQRKLKPRRKPIFYIAASEADRLVATLRDHGNGIARNKYILWTAHYGEGKHICGKGCSFARNSGGVDATQFTTNNETLDESVCKPSFWERG